MFQKKSGQSKGQKKADSSHDSAVTILTSGCHFSGKLFCRGSTRIGGKIEGEIVSEGLLIIEEEAEIHANIRAEEAIIQGVVKGKMEAGGRVELCASSSFEGDIISPVLVIHQGAAFNGRSQMSVVSESAAQVAKISKNGGRRARGAEAKVSDPVALKQDPEVVAPA